jgi:hypothetical protein
MKGPAESGQICSVGRRKIAKKIAKNKRCYANTLRPRSRMLLKVSGLLRVQLTKSGNRVVANVGDGDFQFARPAMPLCQWRDICR